MRKETLFIVGVFAIFGAGVLGFSSFLHSNDVSWSGYLSGLMLNFWGGEQNQLIRVNLHNHSLALYQNGTLYKTDLIAATGNPNNGTRTPTGTFRILSKDKWHISSQHVIMPWALRFSNLGYYFHDIPLTMDGVKISTTYSHGCIRLRDVLAQELFAWTNVGAYVEIYDTALAREDSAQTVYFLNVDGTRQAISSEAAFNRRGFSWANVATVPDGELSGMALGPVIY